MSSPNLISLMSTHQQMEAVSFCKPFLLNKVVLKNVWEKKIQKQENTATKLYW